MPVRSLPDLLNDVFDDTNDGLQVVGNKAHDAADGGGPIKVGGKAATSLPTAVANNDRVDTYHNEYGEVGVLAGSRTVTVTQTLNSGIVNTYTAADAVGNQISLANAVRKSGGSGLIRSVTIIDDAKQAAAMDLVLFNQDFTVTADNSAFDPSDADLENCIGHVAVAAGDYSSFNDNAIATVKSVGLPFVLSGSATLYAQLVTRGTPTWGSSSDITVKVTILQD